jgi:hypothetical protein
VPGCWKIVSNILQGFLHTCWNFGSNLQNKDICLRNNAANTNTQHIEEDHEVPILLGRPFLATVGAIIDVKGGRIVFQVSDERVGFEMESLNKDPSDYSCCMIDDHSVKEHFLASSTQYDLPDPP